MGFRIEAVGWLLRKHYAENMNKYRAMAIGVFGLPLLMTLMSHASESSVSMFSTVAMFSIFYVVHLSIAELRQREKLSLSNTLPVSNAERYAFILLNTTLVLAVWFTVVYGASLWVATTLYPPVFSQLVELTLGNHYVYVGFVGTHAIALLINLAARRRIILPYLAALVVVVAVQYLISKYVPDGVNMSDALRLDVRMWCNVVAAVVAWPLGYVMLKRRQIKI